MTHEWNGTSFPHTVLVHCTPLTHESLQFYFGKATIGDYFQREVKLNFENWDMFREVFTINSLILMDSKICFTSFIYIWKNWHYCFTCIKRILIFHIYWKHNVHNVWYLNVIDSVLGSEWMTFRNLIGLRYLAITACLDYSVIKCLVLLLVWARVIICWHYKLLILIFRYKSWDSF